MLFREIKKIYKKLCFLEKNLRKNLKNNVFRKMLFKIFLKNHKNIILSVLESKREVKNT